MRDEAPREPVKALLVNSPLLYISHVAQTTREYQTVTFRDKTQYYKRGQAQAGLFGCLLQWKLLWPNHRLRKNYNSVSKQVGCNVKCKQMQNLIFWLTLKQKYCCNFESFSHICRMLIVCCLSECPRQVGTKALKLCAQNPLLWTHAVTVCAECGLILPSWNKKGLLWKIHHLLDSMCSFTTYIFIIQLHKSAGQP